MGLVVAALAVVDGRVLIAQRAAGQRLEGMWEFPGGKVEAGETLEAALAREIREEFGVDVVVAEELARTEYDYGDGVLELVAFRTSWPRSPLRLTVHDAVAWPALDEVLSYDLLPADVPIAQQLSTLGG